MVRLSSGFARRAVFTLVGATPSRNPSHVARIRGVRGPAAIRKDKRKLIKKTGLGLWSWSKWSPLDRFYQGRRERTNLEVPDCWLLGRASELQGKAFPMLQGIRGAGPTWEAEQKGAARWFGGHHFQAFGRAMGGADE